MLQEVFMILWKTVWNFVQIMKYFIAILCIYGIYIILRYEVFNKATSHK